MEFRKYEEFLKLYTWEISSPPKNNTKMDKSLVQAFHNQKVEENILIRNLKNTSKIHWDITLPMKLAKIKLQDVDYDGERQKFEMLPVGEKLTQQLKTTCHYLEKLKPRIAIPLIGK